MDKNIKVKDTLLITEFDSVEDLYERAYQDLVDEGYDQDLIELEDEMHDKADEIFEDEVARIESSQDLETWWREHGWTLDRGYGGPNYKERVADETDWASIWDYLMDVHVINDGFGYVVMSPTQVNDLVIFYGEDLEDEEYEDDLPANEYTIIYHQLAEYGDYPERQYSIEDSMGNPVMDDFEADELFFEYYEDAEDYVRRVLGGIVVPEEPEELLENTFEPGGGELPDKYTREYFDLYKEVMKDKTKGQMTIRQLVDLGWNNIISRIHGPIGYDYDDFTEDQLDTIVDIIRTSEDADGYPVVYVRLPDEFEKFLENSRFKFDTILQEPPFVYNDCVRDSDNEVDLEVYNLIFKVAAEDFGVINIPASNVKRISDRTMNNLWHDEDFKEIKGSLWYDKDNMLITIKKNIMVNDVISDIAYAISGILEDVLQNQKQANRMRQHVKPKKWNI